MDGILQAQALGRPTGSQTRAAIIGVACGLFLKQGVQGVTLEAVAASAGLPRTTVYGHFHDRKALFGAVVRFTADQMAAQLTGIGEDGRKPDLEAALLAFGTALLKLFLSPRIALKSHMLTAMLMNDQPIAEAPLVRASGDTHSALALFLAAASARGELAFGSAQAAADDLVRLWEGDMARRLALGLVSPMTPDEIDERVRQGVKMFLRVYRAVPAIGHAPTPQR